MSFSIKQYYHLDSNLKNIDVFKIVIDDLNLTYVQVQKIYEQIKNNQSFIYPLNCYELAQKLYYLTIIMCVLLEKLTTNPVFIVNAETFLKKQKIVSLDVFIFFLNLLIAKLDETQFDLTTLKEIVKLHNEHNNLKYKLDLEQMLRIDLDLNNNLQSTKIIELEIK